GTCMDIVGLDEVGRGCWAGPLVAGAVVLGSPIAGLKDSKKLSKKQREVLALQIHESAKAVGIGWVTAAEVDNIGLTKAVQLAMLRAMKQIDCQYQQIVIDGNINFFSNVQGLKTEDIQTIVRADDTVPAVSAASIVAKVARDTHMADIDKKLPGYGFASNVGYGTLSHRKGLDTHGVTEVHRRSFRPISDLL
ncbi:MAG: ribonuclease HII, partial [Candidatus Saccharimonadales bacterium]